MARASGPVGGPGWRNWSGAQCPSPISQAGRNNDGRPPLNLGADQLENGARLPVGKRSPVRGGGAGLTSFAQTRLSTLNAADSFSSGSSSTGKRWPHFGQVVVPLSEGGGVGSSARQFGHFIAGPFRYQSIAWSLWNTSWPMMVDFQSSWGSVSVAMIQVMRMTSSAGK